jgi:O-succinylbenzoate synthase
VPCITGARLIHVRIPLIEPFRISSGAVSEKDAIVVRLEADGFTGWGESSPMAGAFYSSDTPDSCWAALCDVIIPAVLGREITRDTALPGPNFARVGVETALWDIEAQRAGVPLHRLLGGDRSAVESGLAVGLYDDVNDMLRVIERYLGDGYKRVKIKIEPGRDVELIRAVRRAFGDALPLMVDANAAYTLAHIDVFRALDEFGLMMFEQPLGSAMLEESAELQRQVRTPVCLDESLEDEAALVRAIQLGSFKIANIKIQRVGGFANALRMYEVCRRQGIGIWVGTMPELGIGQAQGVALASLAGCNYPTDVEASARWFRDDYIEPWIEVRNGMIALPEVPGLGYAIREEKLERYQVREKRF